MNTSNPAGRYPPPAPGTGPTRKRSAGSSQACCRRRARSSGERMREIAREHRARAVQDQPAVACEARRPGLVGERSGGRAPGAADRREARIGRAIRRARGRGSSRCPRGRSPRHHSGCARPSSTRITRSQASPSWWVSVAVTSTWPRARRRPSRLCARPRSSSLATSSSSSTRPHAAHLAHEIGLGRQQRQHGRALLALRAVAAQIALALREGELVVMRARRRAAALDVAGAARLELGQLARLVLGPARLVAQLDGLLELADRRQVLRERLAQRRHEPAARTADLRSQLGQLRLPGRQRVVCARPRRAAGAAAGCAAAAPRRRRPATVA